MAVRRRGPRSAAQIAASRKILKRQGPQGQERLKSPIPRQDKRVTFILKGDRERVQTKEGKAAQSHKRASTRGCA